MVAPSIYLLQYKHLGVSRLAVPHSEGNRVLTILTTSVLSRTLKHLSVLCQYNKMVKTRGMSNYAVNLIEEACVNSDNLDIDTETIISNICLALKRLEANHPHISLSDLQLNISSLLQRMDDVLASEKNSGAVIKDLQCDIFTLESRLEREKQQRQSDINASFNELDITREEKDVALKNNSRMLSSLNDVKTKLKNKSDECLSLQSLIGEKDLIIARLKSDLEISNTKKLELTGCLTDLKSLVKKAEEKSWLKSRWVDDTILDTFFQSFGRDTKDSLSKVIFMGPSVTQVVNHGTCDDVRDLLGELRFNKFDYAFLCLCDNTATVKQDTGSHWSLLFVDISSNLVYHLDSLHRANSVVAKAVTIKLGLKVNNLHELSCTQQNNSYECGLSVLVNAKFINEGFCKKTMPGTGSSFSHWYALFNDSPRSLVVTDQINVNVNSLSEKFVAPVNVNSFPQKIVAPVKLIRDCNQKWLITSSKRHKKMTTLKKTTQRPGIECKNKFDVLTVAENKIVRQPNVEHCNNDPSISKPKCVSGNKSRPTSNTSTKKQAVKLLPKCKSINENAETVPSKISSSISDKVAVSKDQGDTFNKNVLLIGDSIIRHSSNLCRKRGAYIECCPGGRILDIKTKLLKYLNQDLSVIYIHVGTNDLKRGYRGKAGYNGGDGKKQALHAMADLLFTTKNHFPNALVFLNSILIRSDISYKALFHFNEQLDLMCMNFGVSFVEANCWVNKHHLARDGRHLNWTGNQRLGQLFSDLFTAVLDNFKEGGEIFSELDLTSVNENIITSNNSKLANNLQSSGNGNLEGGNNMG